MFISLNRGGEETAGVKCRGLYGGSMFYLKYIGFCAALSLLPACGGGTSYNRRGITNNPYGGGITTGVSAGVAVLSSSTGANVSQMQMQIFGTGGKSAMIYNGTAQLTGTITFSGNYGSNYTNISYPTPQYPSAYSAYPAYSQSCAGGPVQFNCQGSVSRGHFSCPNASIRGNVYKISGILGPGRTTAENYEIISVTVLGPCTTPRP